MKNQKIMIIGAGPAGMACAMELSKNGKKSIIIEKEDCVGGFGKTITFKEGSFIFRTDIGPHRFFSKNKNLYKFIEELLGKDWILVNRKTRQLIEGKFYNYPINAVQAFKNVGIFRAGAMGISYLFATIKYKILRKKINCFEDYIIYNFGKKLGEFNMLNYTEKIWGIPCKEIHPDWGKQRIKGLNLTSALKNAILKKDQEGPKSLVDSFYYPRYGTGQIYETIKKEVKEKGSNFEFNSYPTKINHNGKRIKEVEFYIDGNLKHADIDILVSSVPITDLLGMLNPSPPKEVLEAANKLKWRSQVYLFITLDKERVTDDNWIYFPNKEVPFGRITEMKNFSKEMSPKNKTSLFIEFFVNENDIIWNTSKDELFELAMKHLKNFNLVDKKEVRNYYVIKKKKVYPIYDLNYKANLKILKEYINKFENLYCVGRPGRFHYTNQDHSLEMGITAARSIIEGKKYDLDKIGSEEEYFEKGNIKNENQ